MKIPKCMSTQHPDNVSPPFFAETNQMGGEDEIQEAYYVFSHLNCDEQMWDCEGKEVDNYVIKKLLTKHEFFKENRLGVDKFITLRVPNPRVEREEAKILLETLESIPRSFDTARMFYDDDSPPIFEVILPMASSAESLDMVYRYYKDFVAGKRDARFPSGTTIADWIGDFRPEEINVIPLFEDMENMLKAHRITREYLDGKEVDHQRVFLARSDPALNYGLVSAVLLNWISLKRLEGMSRETGVDIYPIVGIGSAPFRGNFRPSTVDRLIEEYSYVHTFTVQSAFKYDHPHDQVSEAVDKILSHQVSPMRPIDEERALDIIDRYSAEYRKQVKELAPLVNQVSKFIPSRRKRKLHIGLFGYSRNMEGLSLPRAITFTASLYSVGLPPELLALNALGDDDLDFLERVWPHFWEDMGDAFQYLDEGSLDLVPDDLARRLRDLLPSFEVDERHLAITGKVLKDIRARNMSSLEEGVVRAASLRQFLG
ncbi:MAG: phosphoenolpyruvate carboxylase [Methanomassiliicoccales archaeon]